MSFHGTLMCSELTKKSTELAQLCQRFKDDFDGWSILVGLDLRKSRSIDLINDLEEVAEKSRAIVDYAHTLANLFERQVRREGTLDMLATTFAASKADEMERCRLESIARYGEKS